MLKLEIKMDDKKIISEHIYKIESIYQTLEEIFSKYRLRMEKEADGTIYFYGTGDPRDYGAFGSLITSLKEQEWFMNYVVRWVWYNSDDGHNENDFAVEDVLYHYTRKASFA